jgi:1,4-alpha-glucan branching enzyme
MKETRPPAKATRNGCGELVILLHSHMPYVEGFGTWPFGEEWLLEATASSYLRLIEVLERHADLGRRDLATVGVTPVLADQLALAEVGERFLRFMRGTRRECHREDIAGLAEAGEIDAAAALRLSAADYEHAADGFERRGGDLLGALVRLRDRGAVDLWASCATHAVLPLLATGNGVRMQVEAGVASHRERFGAWSGGFWLPECAYRPGLEDELARAGVRAFCVDQTRVADPLDHLQPVAVGGTVAVPLDWSTISLVWDDAGYPSDPVYRDYHAQTVNGMRAWANSGRPYDRDAAHARARRHAADFVNQVIRRATAYRLARGRAGLVLCALDTELLGHWWYEGPMWLDAVIEEADRRGLALTTLPGALSRHEPRQAEVFESSWGTGKDLHTWDSPAVADLVWTTRESELRLVAALGSAPADWGAPAARRAARELLALQSSDWAFMRSRGLAGDYPRERVRNHTLAFGEALSAIRPSMTDSRAMNGGGPHSSGTQDGRPRLDERLRGLAPNLELAPLVAPSSIWRKER